MFYMTNDEIDKIFPVDDGWSDIDRGDAIGKRQGAKWMRDKLFGNVPQADSVQPQLAEVRARIECMMLITDCALDDTEQRRINRSFSDGYNKAIRDILNMMSEHFI